MFAKYIIRLDDACPTMDLTKWDRIERILDKYGIKAIVAVIPNNEDTSLFIDEFDSSFWDKVRAWDNKGWDIALHGYNHVYTTAEAGIVPKNKRSEFAGVTFDKQRQKIREGVNVFRRNNLNPRIWIAPSHTFDFNTLEAIKAESDINIISDGIAMFPYKEFDFNWLPQQIGQAYYMPLGCWTICLHPNTMTDVDFDKLNNFIKKYKYRFICLNTVSFNKKRLVDKLFAFIYWRILK